MAMINHSNMLLLRPRSRGKGGNGSDADPAPASRRVALALRLSGLSLAAGHQSIDEDKDDRAHNTGNKARALADPVPSDGLPEIGRDESADDSQNRRQNKALRLKLVAGH